MPANYIYLLSRFVIRILFNIIICWTHPIIFTLIIIKIIIFWLICEIIISVLIWLNILRSNTRLSMTAESWILNLNKEGEAIVSEALKKWKIKWKDICQKNNDENFFYLKTKVLSQGYSLESRVLNEKGEGKKNKSINTY